MDIDYSKLSPMMRQYLDVKKKYPEHILFFRIGDFYEMFFDDAIHASKALELTLTGKDCGLAERAPMCGIPHHASEIYIKRLIDAGYKVAICEQLTDPAQSKGLVERDVIKIVTAGTLTETSMLDDSSNNYLCAIFAADKECAVCFADISTGDVSLFRKGGKELSQDIINELSRFSPAEIIYNEEFSRYKTVCEFISERLRAQVQSFDGEYFSADNGREAVLKQFSADSFSALGVEDNSIEARCLCGLFGYVANTQKALIGRFTGINIYRENKFMGLDLTARRNLEITETMRGKEKKGSLLWVLDHTKTSMGKRLLKTYLEQPLISPAAIIARLDAVEQLFIKSVVMSELIEALSSVYDLERLMTRVVYKTATPRDLKALSATAMQLPKIKALLGRIDRSSLLKRLCEDIDTLDDISALVENSINDDPPVSVKDGGVIKSGFNEQLDSLREVVGSGKDIIAGIEREEREKTGIQKLKIGYNRVFGYYIEVTKSNYSLVPDRYIRKQTLANCERFITEELKNAENTIAGANDRILSLEQDIFSEIRDFIAGKLPVVQKTAAAIAAIDVLCSFAYTAAKNGYTKPDIAIDGAIEIKDGRHPVVELMLRDELFVPNDTYLDTKENRMAVITGPNMSGKSTYMRQVALITLMAQVGSFVPAKSARISVVDKIFTRVGASDDLTAGQSTFMVEMSEVSDILRHATSKSLVILDEVGRGTSTFDGISIARAVAEYISSKSIGCKTLFATHYHELIELERECVGSGIRNYSVAVKKAGDSIRFLRKIVPGGVDDSYGIEVAKLAGLPPKVVARAKELLSEMEKATPKGNTDNDGGQMSFTALGCDAAVERLRKTNAEELSPEEAKEFLSELCEMVR